MHCMIQCIPRNTAIVLSESVKVKVSESISETSKMSMI
jgi:hypothetical protein